MKLPSLDFHEVIVAVLVAGCVVHPAAAAAGLLILALKHAAEKYFTRNISDQDRKTISALKAELEKVSSIQQKEGLAKAFGGQRL